MLKKKINLLMTAAVLSFSPMVFAIDIDSVTKNVDYYLEGTGVQVDSINKVEDSEFYQIFIGDKVGYTLDGKQIILGNDLVYRDQNTGGRFTLTPPSHSMLVGGQPPQTLETEIIETETVVIAPQKSIVDEFILNPNNIEDSKFAFNMNSVDFNPSDEFVQKKIEEFNQTYPENPVDLTQFIATKYGNGERVVVVISDPLCPFCVSFQSEVNKNPTFTNATVFTGLVAIQPNAEQKINFILSQEDPALAYESWMHYVAKYANVIPMDEIWSNWVQETKRTENSTLETLEQVKMKKLEVEKGYNAWGVSATPTQIFQNGTGNVGYIPQNKLLEYLKYAQENPLKM